MKENEINSLVQEMKSSQNPTSKTGACNISVGTGVNYCFDGLTKDACFNTAVKLGGTSTWREGNKCPK